MIDHPPVISLLACVSILLVVGRLWLSVKNVGAGYSLVNVVFWCAFFCYFLLNPVVRVLLLPFEGFYELFFMRYPRADLGSSYAIVLVAICVFAVCFNLKLVRFSPPDNIKSDKVGRLLCLLLVPALLMAFWRYQVSLQELVSDGYLSISHGLANSKAWNIASYTLPRLIVILIFLTCRSAKMLIPACLAWMIMEGLVLLTGQRSPLIYTSAMVGVILHDRFLYRYFSSAKIFAFLGVIGPLIIVFSITTVSIRNFGTDIPKETTELYRHILQFSMPFDVGRYIYNEAQHISGVNGSFLFGYYYYCDLLSNIFGRNMCGPVTGALYMPGFYMPALNFLDDPTGYLNGGMSGGSLIGGLLVASTFNYWPLTIFCFASLSFFLSQIINSLGSISGGLIKELFRFNAFLGIIKLPAHGIYIFIPFVKFLAPISLIAIFLVIYSLAHQKVLNNPFVKNRKRTQQDNACDS